jgi:hypothetical protein
MVMLRMPPSLIIIASFSILSGACSLVYFDGRTASDGIHDGRFTLGHLYVLFSFVLSFLLMSTPVLHLFEGALSSLSHILFLHLR